MGDLNRGETFANGEQVTAARLNAMQDNATIVSGAVTTSKIADGAVTPAKLAGGFAFTAGQVQIASGALIGGNGSNVGTAITPDGSTVEISGSSLRVKDAGIGTAKIADGGITAAKLAARVVSAAKFAAVTSARLLGRFSAGSGDFEEISIGSGLSLSAAGVLSSSGAFAPTTFVGAEKALPTSNGFVQWAAADGWPYSSVPKIVDVRLRCIVGDAGVVSGVELPLGTQQGWVNSLDGGMIAVDATGVQVRVADGPSGPWYILGAGGAASAISDRTRWRLVCYCLSW